MDHYTFRLTNGIRVVHEYVDSPVSHCGLMVRAGTRDEKEDEQGLAHFIEHCLFKGTDRRKAHHILSRLDRVGGEINAYTTKEITSIYASFLNEHFERALELLADITFGSTFPERELEKEKEVIIDEIHSYLDSPSDQIFDDFEEYLFHGHPIGRNILGTVESVKSFTREDALSFIDRNYLPEQMIFSVVGPIKEKKLRRLADKYLNGFERDRPLPQRKPFEPNGIFQKSLKRSNYQAHCILGTTAYAANDDNRRPLILLNNILGGPALNSRLGMEVREKKGYAYSIESNYMSYSDTGIFQIYFGTDVNLIEKTRKIVLRELKKMREKKLSPSQLNQAKTQLKGQIALARESNVATMLSLGKTLLIYDDIDTYEEVYKSVDAITAEQIQDVANDVLAEDRLSTLIFTP